MFTRRVYQRDDVSAFTIALGTTNDSTHSDLVMRKDGDFPCQLLLHLDFTLREDGSLWEDGDCFQHQPPALRYQFVQMFSVLILTYNPLAGCLCAVPRRGAWSGRVSLKCPSVSCLILLHVCTAKLVRHFESDYDCGVLLGFLLAIAINASLGVGFVPMGRLDRSGFLNKPPVCAITSSFNAAPSGLRRLKVTYRVHCRTGERVLSH
jgi:hypothetical protein